MTGGSKKQKEKDITTLHLWQIQWVRDLMLIIVAICGVWLGYAMREITIPLLVALLLAYLFDPLISFLADNPKFPLGRIPVISGILTLLTTGVLVVLAISIPMVVSQTTSLVGDIQEGKLRSQLERVTQEYAPEDVREEILETISYLPSSSEDSEATTGATLTTSELSNKGLVQIAHSTSDVIISVVGAIIHFAIMAVLIPFYFFFFSLWFPEVRAFASSLIPDDGKTNTMTLLHKMDAAVAGFVRGRIVIAFIMAVVLVVGWMIVGVPYAILLGIGVGIFCAVPFLGLIGIPLSVGLLFLDQLGVPEAERMAWWGIIVWPILVFAIVQALDAWVLTPLIAGRATNLDPVTIFVAVLAGGSVLGAYGMLLAIPVAACIKILIQERLLPKIHAWTRGEVDDPLPFDD